jgi:hypothetical protein
MSTSNIVAIREAEVSLSSRTWNFSQDYAVAIDGYWHLRTAQQPSLFNGDILLLAPIIRGSGRLAMQARYISRVDGGGCCGTLATRW